MTSSTTRPAGPLQRTMSLNIAPRPKDGEAASSSSDLVSIFPRLSNSNSTTLHRLYIANKAELTRHVSAGAGAREYLWGGDDWFVRWYEAPPLVVDGHHYCTDGEDDVPGFDADSHNLIEHQILPWPVIGGAVDMVISRFEAQRRRFSWVVGPMDQPQLESSLRNRDLFLEEDEPAMVVDLDNCAPLNVKTETLPLSPQEAARFRLRDYQLQLMRLEQQNRRRLMLARALDAKSQKSQAVGGECGVPTEHRQTSPINEQLRCSQRGQLQIRTGTGENFQAPATGAAAGVGRTAAKVHSFYTAQPTFAEDTRPPLHDGYEIKPIADAVGVTNWVRAWAHEAKSPNAAGVQHWARVYAALFTQLPSTQFQMFAAFRPSPGGSRGGGKKQQKPDNNPVLGTGYVHMYEGVAAIHCVVVRPEFRGRGIGRELARFGMRLARERGYRMAMVTGTPLALGVFRALGFKDIGRIKLYVWRPLKDPVRAPDPEDQTAEAERDGWEWVE
ncbi:hypothetical protein F5X99DRAFT_401467 [Biscogniauxia marginata]|nr:hypothetical protein F5X99DRAFT_401467 [Biscogniauxia marginata]